MFNLKWYFIKDHELQATCSGTLVAILELQIYDSAAWVHRMYTAEDYGLFLYHGRVSKHQLGDDYE